MRLLAGKVAIVTGAGRARGMGFGIARRLAEAGASVVMSDVAALHEELGSRAQELRDHGHPTHALVCDVTNPGEVEGLVAQTIAAFGRLDILVNNAGVIVTKLVVDTTAEDWDVCAAVIGKGTFLCSKAAVQAMVQQGTGGRIINISSISGKRGVPYFAAYTFAKMGVIGFTQTLAREMAPHAITVNAICPGVVETDMLDRIRADRAVYEGAPATTPMQPIPLGRNTTPAEVGGLAVFLASPAAAYMTGQAINFDGGMVMH
jgi:meso-butanediol dehydrogenase / (S,S)-butanediol dehydrogenase / diacetyl reductase